MRVKKVYGFVLLLIFIFTVSLQAQNSTKNKKTTNGTNSSRIQPLEFKTSKQISFVVNGQTLGADKVFTYLIEHNEEINQVLYDAAKADSDYQKFQTKYSPVLQADGKVVRQEYPEDALTSFSATEYKEQSGSVALRKGFSTGTSVTTGLQHTYANNIGLSPLYGDVEYHQPMFFVTVEQELLKNVLGYQDRRQNRMLKNKETIIEELTLYQVSAITVDAIIKSWDLVLASSSLSNARLKLQETRNVRKIIRANVNLGLNERFDLNYWNALVAAHNMQVTQARYQYLDRQRAVMIKFNIEDPESMGNGIAVLADSLPDLDVQKALSNALLNRADYKQAKLELLNARMALEMYQNDALPSMKAGVTLSTVGQRDHSGDAYSDALAGKSPNVEATISFTYPLSNRQQEIDERDAAMSLKQAQLQMARTEKEIKKDVYNSIDGIKAAYDAYQDARRARIESERYYINLRRYLRKGRFSAATIKDALDAMVDSRQRELEALVQYNAALLQFDIVQNRLFKKYDVNIQSYVQKKKGISN